jgi:putative dimethyl sulfoxide reductase chaperone
LEGDRDVTHSDYGRLAGLFLQELDVPALEALAVDSRFASSLPADLQDARVEFTRLFAMSVYAYSSVFLGPTPELNGESTAEVEAFYRRVGFETPSEWMLGAADALGAELACCAMLIERGMGAQAEEFLCGHLLSWAPICCLAVERNAHLPIYRKLGAVTRESLMQDAEGLCRLVVPRPNRREEESEERDLHWVVDRMIAPARCGIFLSRQDLYAIGQRVEVPVGFGDRQLMLASLLRGSGSNERVKETLGELQNIVGDWERSYTGWKENYPRAAALWEPWLRRAETTSVLLAEMQETSLQD